MPRLHLFELILGATLGGLLATAQPASDQGVAPAAAPANAPAPPPAAPPQRSAAELEQLVAPIALYPDPLVATLLPASVYPLEVVQAARFVADTNNLAQLEAQPWDENVKAVARVPAVIQKMNEDLPWTMALGEAFVAQEQELMAAIQSLRGKAQQAGTLRSSPQQVVVVTNTVVEKTIEQQLVVVTNTVVQIQPASPQVIYVPQYNPAVVYAPPPTYVYDPMVPLVTFGVGLAVGAALANDCDWHGGGVYVGHHGVAVWGGGHGDVDVNVNRNVNINNPPRAAPYASGQQKWQPDQSRMNRAGVPNAATVEARGWGTAATQPAAARASAGSVQAQRVSAPSANRAASSPVRAAPATSPSFSRSSGNSGQSAFSGMSSGATTRSYSNRGAASRSGGFGGGGGRGRGR